MKITKSMVMNYRPAHFAESAEHFARVGAAWENTSAAQHSEAMALPWKGLAATAYRLVAAADHATVMAASEQANAAAAVSAADGATVWDAQVAAQAALTEADAAGINVSEDLSQVTDALPPSPDPATRAARQAQVAAHAQAIGSSVSALVTADAQAAANIRAAADFSAYHTSPNGHVQATGFGTDKPPAPLPPPVPTGAPVNNGPAQTPWPPAGGVPASVANPKMAVPPQVINQHPPDPNKHPCTPQEIAKATAQGTGGAAMIAGAVGGIPETGGMSILALPPGLASLIDGTGSLARCQDPQ